MGISQADSNQVGTLLFEFRLMFAQLRDVLAAKNSTIVTKENNYGRALGPHGSKLDGLSVAIRQSYGS